MGIFETPGVYFERTDTNSGGVAALRTDVAGFVGIAQRGPLDLAVPVDSYRQFTAWFGAPIENGYLAYSARAFFENGGRRLWAVRVTSEAASVASLTLLDDAPAPAPVWRIEASSAGVWGNDLGVRLRETRRAQARAFLAAYDPRRVRVDSMAGFERHALVEIRQGAVRVRAILRELDAASSTLLLDRDIAGLDPSAPARAETVLYTIEVYDAGRLLGVFTNLSVVPEHPRYAPALLAQPWQILDRRHPDDEPPAASSAAAIQYFRVARDRLSEAPPPIVVRELRGWVERGNLAVPVETGLAQLKNLAGGADGLSALAVHDFIGYATSPLDSDTALAVARRGLRALDEVDEIALVAVPDIHIQPLPPVRERRVEPCEPDPCLSRPVVSAAPQPRSVGDAPPHFSAQEIYRVQAAMVQQCETRRDRIALLDAPFDACTGGTMLVSALRSWRSLFDSPFAALYAPWVGVVDPLRTRPGSAARAGKLTRAIPPSGHVAGTYAATDVARGVHVAAANAPLEWVQEATLAIEEERHGLLNSLHVNVIRAQPGRGLRLLGARTLSSDSDWRFVNVRRLMSMIGKALETSLQWAVFEPNDWRTRAKLSLVAGSFLQELWTRGALVGATAAEAYFVRCDDGNNPPETRARGELLLRIGIAPSVPMEFVVVRIGRDANGLALSEEGSVKASA
jgi:phage tail sheath protein FI